MSDRDSKVAIHVHDTMECRTGAKMDRPREECACKKTYNSEDSLVVTHLTTNSPVHCLYMAERTGSLVFSVLWSYVVEMDF